MDLGIDNDEKVASWKDTHIKARAQKHDPLYDQNGGETIPFGAAHTFIVPVREYPLSRDIFRLTSIASESIYIRTGSGV